MTTQELLNTLALYPDRPLVFEADGQKVAPGYHVTEVMNVTYEGMDCGGQASFWRETVVQLMGPGPADPPEFMTVKKFLGIYRRVAASVPVRDEAEIRFEYGDAARPAVRYHVGQVGLQGEYLVVRLSPPGVTCKARDRASDCCGSKALELEAAPRCC